MERGRAGSGAGVIPSSEFEVMSSLRRPGPCISRFNEPPLVPPWSGGEGDFAARIASRDFALITPQAHSQKILEWLAPCFWGGKGDFGNANCRFPIVDWRGED